MVAMDTFGLVRISKPSTFTSPTLTDLPKFQVVDTHLEYCQEDFGQTFDQKCSGFDFQFTTFDDTWRIPFDQTGISILIGLSSL
jgi:hypothetical protein